MMNVVVSGGRLLVLVAIIRLAVGKPRRIIVGRANALTVVVLKRNVRTIPAAILMLVRIHQINLSCHLF